MVYRVYVEKKTGFDVEAKGHESEIRDILGIQNLSRLRLLNRYDVENVEEALFTQCVPTVFSEPPVDEVLYELPRDGSLPLAVEYLPGQYDQRADSAAQCVQIISQGERPQVRTARVFLLYGPLTAADLAAIEQYLINPVESRKATLEKPQTLAMEYHKSEKVEIVEDFNTLSKEGLSAFLKDRGLAMDLSDLAFCQQYFQKEGRAPTITEIKVLDTYWSDHCRHTTFNTVIDSAAFADKEIESSWQQYLDTRKALGRRRPISLMDIATIAAKALKAAGKLDKLDESAEVNACTVKTTVTVDGEAQDWLLLFKNETHNHPTEIEPVGGAATCIGGAIRDPLSGRAYVYAAMRIAGSADPRQPIAETLPGKLPQRTIATRATGGYAGYGNQIGLTTGLVDEIYHPGFAAKHMELGAVIGAVPAAQVRRETPAPGDVVLLVGGGTGRDGLGGATGSSKAHTEDSLATGGAEVQKGNAPEERKLQRLFRNPAVSLLIKRCNDFGAGGVSVAIGELADGLDINLSAVPKKYEGLDGTELALSESQERMAVVVSPADAETFIKLAGAENLEATPVATVTAAPRLVMRWQGDVIVDIARQFLDTNGTEKHADAAVAKAIAYEAPLPAGFAAGMQALASDINFSSRKGMLQKFDSSIGAGTVLMPHGGVHQRTPIQTMVHRLPAKKGHTDHCSFMAYGYDPYLMEQSPYHGAYLSVVHSLAKLAAAGASMKEVYLSFQEYFEKLRSDPLRWGKPLAALLGAFQAQMDYGVAAIGGKDSMSGSFENLDVPPTLVSFAVTTGIVDEVISPEFKTPGGKVVWLQPETGESGLPKPESFKTVLQQLKEAKPAAAWAVGRGGIAEAVLKMALGGGFGFRFAEGITLADLFRPRVGAFVAETDMNIGTPLGEIAGDGLFTLGGETVALSSLQETFEGVLEGIYPQYQKEKATAPVQTFTHRAEKPIVSSLKIAKPRALIVVFPGTNCEYDTAKGLADAGAETEIFVIQNRTPAAIADSVSAFAKRLADSQIVLVPGGFSGGDEPDGSGKFITAFFRSPAVTEGVRDLLQTRSGLMAGICNGFQALIKLGLVPYGDIVPMDAQSPTLTFNTLGYQSRMVRTRISSNLSPWFSEMQPGEIFTMPVAHGEGRFVASEAQIQTLAQNGQIAAQYVDLNGNPTMDILYNPNGSAYAIETITSPDGRVLGKMAHAERCLTNHFKNIPGRYDMGLFRSAVRYFQY